MVGCRDAIVSTALNFELANYRFIGILSVSRSGSERSFRTRTTEARLQTPDDKARLARNSDRAIGLWFHPFL